MRYSSLMNNEYIGKEFHSNLLNRTSRVRWLVCLDCSLTALRFQDVFAVNAERREQVIFGIYIENVELMHEGSPKHLRMGTERLK